MGFDLNFKQEALSLQISELRSTMIAKNIAHSNTPNYKATDINFAEAMKAVKQSNGLTQTHLNHINPVSGAHETAHTYYRVPMQGKSNGNTVDEDIERKNFIENTLRYQSSLSFLQQRGALLLKTIKGD